MQRWTKGLAVFVAVGIAAGACTDVERISAPDAPRLNESAVPADSTGLGPQNAPPADTTGGRWGGYLGGGGG
jgi:hypothetical protein